MRFGGLFLAAGILSLALGEPCAAGDEQCGVSTEPPMQSSSVLQVTKGQAKVPLNFQVKRALLAKSMAHAYTSSVCKDCKGGCVVDGTCFERDPEGAVPVEQTCNSYGGTMCPGDLAPLPPFCASETDLIPEKVVSKECYFEEMHENASSYASCSMSGCVLAADGVCVCERCDDFGGTAIAITCEFLAGFWELDIRRQAEMVNSCEGLKVEHEGETYDLLPAMTYLASTCCSTYPNSMCAPNARDKFTPCKDPQDFKPDNVFKADSIFGGHTCAEEWLKVPPEQTLWGLWALDNGCSAVDPAYAAAFGGKNFTETVAVFARDCCTTYPETHCSR